MYSCPHQLCRPLEEGSPSTEPCGSMGGGGEGVPAPFRLLTPSLCPTLAFPPLPRHLPSLTALRGHLSMPMERVSWREGYQEHDTFFPSCPPHAPRPLAAPQVPAMGNIVSPSGFTPATLHPGDLHPTPPGSTPLPSPRTLKTSCEATEAASASQTTPW